MDFPWRPQYLVKLIHNNVSDRNGVSDNIGVRGVLKTIEELAASVRFRGESWLWRGTTHRVDRGQLAFLSVFLMLAAFLDEEVVSQILQADLLAEPKLVKTFIDLCGRGGNKPLECVGRLDESHLALYLASKRRTANPLHPDLVTILPEAAEVAELQKRVLHTYNDENGLPPHWNDQLRKMI